MIEPARQGETVDALCWRVFGRTDMTEAVLALNPGLAALGPVLPVGQPVTLPDAPASAAAMRDTVKLWD